MSAYSTIAGELRIGVATDGAHLILGEWTPPRSERCFRAVYQVQSDVIEVHQSLRLDPAVTRRVLCEFRDY